MWLISRDSRKSSKICFLSMSQAWILIPYPLMEPWHFHGYYGYGSSDLPIQSTQRQSLNTTQGPLSLRGTQSFWQILEPLTPKSKVKEETKANNWPRANMLRKSLNMVLSEINTVHARDTHLSATKLCTSYAWRWVVLTSLFLSQCSWTYKSWLKIHS